MKIDKKDKLPYFPFYPNDWLSDSKVFSMSREERGEYIDMLCYSWINDGLDEHMFNTCSTHVQECFSLKLSGKHKNSRQEKERKKINDLYEKRRLAGMESGKARKEAKKSSNKARTKLEQKGNKGGEESESESDKELKDKNILFDVVDLELANLLKSLILQNKPTRKIPDNIDTWANDIRKLRELDKRTPEQIKAVIQWSQQDSFWWSNILSASKLRKQFDKLEDRMNDNKPNNDQNIKKENEYREPYLKEYSFLDVPDERLKPHEVKEKHRILAEREKVEQAGK